MVIFLIVMCIISSHKVKLLYIKHFDMSTLTQSPYNDVGNYHDNREKLKSIFKGLTNPYKDLSFIFIQIDTIMIRIVYDKNLKQFDLTVTTVIGMVPLYGEKVSDIVEALLGLVELSDQPFKFEITMYYANSISKKKNK